MFVSFLLLSMLSQAPNQTFRIATYNIRNTQDRYLERKDLLKETIHNVKADIIGLQEVAFGDGGQLDELVDGKFSQLLAPTKVKYTGPNHPDKEARLDGNAIILGTSSINENIKDHSVFEVSEVRSAQKLVTSVNGKPLIILNTHLHHVIEDGNIRLQQLDLIFRWIEEDLADASLNIILLGDFNFMPPSDEYKLVESKGFKSTFKVVNGIEPELTFPTGLTGPHMDTDPPGTFDYIWFRGPNLTPVTANTFGEKQKEGVEGVYPSDHLGVVGQFVIA